MNFLLSKNIPRYQDNQDHRDGNSPEGNSKKDDPELPKPIHDEREDLGASSNFKERKLGVLGMSTLALAGLMALASPLLALAIAFPVLHWRFSEPPQPPPQKEDDLDIENRQRRIDELKSAIDGAQNKENFLDPKSPIPSKSAQPLKPILKKSPAPQQAPQEASQQIDALDLASPSRVTGSNPSSPPRSNSNIEGLDLASPPSLPSFKSKDALRRDLDGVAGDLSTSSPPPPAKPPKQRKQVRFGPDQAKGI